MQYLSAQEDELIPFKEKGRWGVLNNAEKIIIPPKYDKVNIFRGKYIHVQKKEKWGLFDMKGTPLLRCKYDAPLIHTSDGLIQARKKEKWGIVDTLGHFLIKPRYERITPFFNGLARVIKDGKMGMVTPKGEIQIPIIYDHLPPHASNHFLIASQNEKWGLIDLQGNWIAQPNYDSLKKSNDHPFIAIHKNNQWGYLDTTGRELLTFKKELVPVATRNSSWDDLKQQFKDLEQCHESKEITEHGAIFTAKNNGLYHNISPSYPVTIRMNIFNSQCVWEITTVSTSHTREGDCKYTNGCTVVLRKTLYIETINGEVVHRFEKRKLYPNYE